MKTIIEKLYKDYSAVLYKFAIGLTGDVDYASDIVQTIFMRLGNKDDAQLQEITKAYLFTAVRNGAKDLWKSKKTIPFSKINVAGDETSPLMDIPDSALTPDQQMETSSDLDIVLSALQQLTDEQRQVLTLKYFSGFKTNEIAVHMTKNDNTIRQIEYRALQSIRRLIRKENDHGFY